MSDMCVSELKDHRTSRCTSHPLCNEDVVSGLPYIFSLIKLWNNFSTVMLRYFRAMLVTEGGSFSLTISFRAESHQRQTAKRNFAGKAWGGVRIQTLFRLNKQKVETACCQARNDTTVLPSWNQQCGISGTTSDNSLWLSRVTVFPILAGYEQVLHSAHLLCGQKEVGTESPSIR